MRPRPVLDWWSEVLPEARTVDAALAAIAAARYDCADDKLL